MNLLCSDLHYPLCLFGILQGVLQLSELLVTCVANFAKVSADLFEPRTQDREGTQGLLRFSVQVVLNFTICLRLSFVRLAQARLLPIQDFLMRPQAPSHAILRS